MEESMKKKNLIVAIVMASMIMGGCGQKTVTSVSEDPTVSEAPMKEDTLEPEAKRNRKQIRGITGSYRQFFNKQQCNEGK